MLISDYANAFFFDRRNRVTPSNREGVLSRRREVAIAISKACPIMTKINIDHHRGRYHRGYQARGDEQDKPGVLHRMVKTRARSGFAGGKLQRGRTIEKKKARRSRAF
jgi:hypothetical protein